MNKAEMMNATRTFALVCCLVGIVLPAHAGDVLLEHHDVFINGEVIDGLHYNTYRIPNIARANDGTLIAVAEARLSNSSDPGGTHIDLVYKRSLDGGKTWTDGHVLDRHPDTVVDGAGVPTNRTSAANSVTLVDRSTGRIWNLNMRLPHATPSAATQPGVDDMQTWARFSDDSGATWSTPTHVVGNTAAIPYEDFYPNLGSATQLSTGRLVVPATEDNATVASKSFALYSDDNGKTWSAGAQVDVGTNEAQIVELNDGRLLMTARQNGGKNRKFAISDDQGETWNPSYNGFTSTAVMEGVERYTQVGINGETVDRLLHTIPVGGPVAARTNLEVLTATCESKSGGPTFGCGRRVIHGWAAYSDLVNIDGDEAGVFWERGDKRNNERITYTRINRAFLEPESTEFGLVAHEGFDYAVGRTLSSVDGPSTGQNYAGGHAPVSFSGRTDLDLVVTVDMNTATDTATISSGVASNDQANGIFGQILSTSAVTGVISQISIKRAPNGTAGAPVYLHIYSDVDLSDGIDAETFLGSSLTAETLNPTDSGITKWEFDGNAAKLSPTTEYLIAFASSTTPGDITTARAAVNVAPSSSGYALGGNGFNSAWHSDAIDLTNGQGASDAKVAEGSLTFAGYRLPTMGNHVQIEGGEIARGLGVCLGLNAEAIRYVSALVSRSADDGLDEGTNEALEFALMDSSGKTHVRFGVDDNEAVYVDGPGGLSHTATDIIDPKSTYLMVLKIVTQDDSSGANVDQLFMKVFKSGEAIPDSDENLAWTLVGNADTNLSAAIDRLSIVGGKNALWSLDELRVGGDFGSVASGVIFTFAGDLNLDGVLDLLDWVAFKKSFYLSTAALGPMSQPVAGDLDHSGKIDSADQFIQF